METQVETQDMDFDSWVKNYEQALDSITPEDLEEICDLAARYGLPVVF
jgi:selenophosphate synthetase-related protein